MTIRWRPFRGPRWRLREIAQDPAAAPGAATIDGGSIASAEVLGQPSVNAQVDGAGGVVSAEAIGGAGVAATLAAAGVVTAEAQGQPGVGAQLDVAGIASADSEGQPSITAAISSAAIASLEVLGAPVAAATVSALGVDTAEALGAPGASVGVVPAGIASSEGLGGLVASVEIGVAGAIASAEAIGRPIVFDPSLPLDITDVGGIASAEQVGAPTVGAESEGVADVGAPDGGINITWMPTWSTLIAPSAQAISSAGGIASGEAFGLATITPIDSGPPRRSRRVREEEYLLKRAA